MNIIIITPFDRHNTSGKSCVKQIECFLRKQSKVVILFIKIFWKPSIVLSLSPIKPNITFSSNNKWIERRGKTWTIDSNINVIVRVLTIFSNFWENGINYTIFCWHVVIRKRALQLHIYSLLHSLLHSLVLYVFYLVFIELTPELV